MAVTVLTTVHDERSTPTYTASLVDAAGDPVADSQLTGLWLTLYDVQSATVINGRDRQDILNANGVTVDHTGALTWVLAEADMAILDDALALEEHAFLIESRWTAGGVARVAYDLTIFTVRNLLLVPAP